MGLAAIFLMHASPQGLGGIEMIATDREAQEPKGIQQLVDELHDMERDKEELLDALQGIHNTNERHDRSMRIHLLIKHGRIQDPKEGQDAQGDGSN